MKQFKDKINAFFIGWFLVIISGFPLIIHAENYVIHPDPLFLGGSIDANIMLTFDDSGSMMWQMLPPDGSTARQTFDNLWPSVDKIYGTAQSTFAYYLSRGGNRSFITGTPYFEDYTYSMRARSAVNTLYYNPSIIYTPWSESDGTLMPDSNPECALHNPVSYWETRGYPAPTGPFPKSDSRRLADYNNRNGCIDLTRDWTLKTWWRKYDADSTDPSFASFPIPIGSIGKGKFEMLRVRNNKKTKPNSDKGGREYNPGYKHYAWVRNEKRTFYPATFYEFTGRIDNLPETWDRNNYTRVEIRPENAPFGGGIRLRRTDCTSAANCTYAQEMQNFANWYTYYRARALSAKAGIGQAFADQKTNLRVGFTVLNKGFIRGLKPFIDKRANPGPPAIAATTDRSDFFDLFYRSRIGGGTPLLRALDQVGRYYQTPAPWQATPGIDDPNPIACRQSFSILMTDGFWNGALPNNIGNRDGKRGSEITGPDNDPYTYEPTPPFQDTPTSSDVNSFGVTLADVAMKYWMLDLQSGNNDELNIPNRVSTSASDPAFWQHMVTFTIGFGVVGEITPTEFSKIEAGARAWPLIVSGGLTTVDDLWHAGVNGHGGYFNAKNPQALAQGLSSTLNALANRVSSSASVALNSGSTAGAARVYQAKFDSGDWTGDLISFELNGDGSIGNEKWRASAKIPSWSNRKILSYSGTAGIEFQWGKLTLKQRSLLRSNLSIFRYIRGDGGIEERNGGFFRNRPNNLLGDIIHSAPAYVGKPPFHYSDDLEDRPYSAFVAANVNRKPLIYVGANDGMIHAFREDTNGPDGIGPFAGDEVFAYVPLATYDRLVELAYPTQRSLFTTPGNFGSIPFSHQFFVDGSPTVVDAFLGGQWRTILISGLNAGGQGVFAIDVTDPDSFNTENNGKRNVLWEFTDKSYNGGSTFDNDLGYTFSQPNIVRMNTGWYAIFGNGYNATVDNDADGSVNDSTSGNAIIYILDLQTGALVNKIDTGVGLSDAASGGFPNGISGVAPVDSDGDDIVDLIYAGDLFGNLWKINVPDNPASATIANGGKPLFTACSINASPCPVEQRQSITSRPQVGAHPTEYGQMVYFGTGTYFQTLDANPANQAKVQTFYGIWDKYEIPNNGGPDGIPPVAFTPFTKNSLLQQDIVDEVTSSFNIDTTGNGVPDSLENIELRKTTDNKIDFAHWKVPFPNSAVTNVGQSYLGWHLDLINLGSNPITHRGERQISDSVLRNGRIIFVTIVPDQDPCSIGGESWLMELNAGDGSRLDIEPFDLNGDGEFTNADRIQGNTIVPSGKKSAVGITSTPGIASIANRRGTSEVKLNSGSDGNLESTKESNQNEQQRRSWVHLK